MVCNIGKHEKIEHVLSLLNQDMERLSSWLDHNYLRDNGDKTQAMVLGKSTHHYDLKFNGAPIDIKAPKDPRSTP